MDMNDRIINTDRQSRIEWEKAVVIVFELGQIPHKYPDDRWNSG